MIFKAKENLEVPIEQVFEYLSDFEKYERLAMRRGAEVTRCGDFDEPEAGCAWDISFRFRGRDRKAKLTMADFQPTDEIRFNAVVQGLTADILIELVALSRTRTRMNVTSELKASTLSARLLLQSLKLTRGKLERRFSKRISGFARELEDRFSAAA